MAEYLIEDTTLEDIADSIRAKDGTSADIQVSDFAQRIEDIPSGSTEPIWEEMVDGSITECVSSNLTTILRGKFNYTDVEKISLPNVVDTVASANSNGLGIAQYCPSLRHINMPNLSNMLALATAFANNTSLKVLYLPKAYGTGGQMIQGNTSQEKFICPKHNSTNVTGTFIGCTSLKLIDMNPSRVAIDLVSTNLETVIMRNTSLASLDRTSRIPNDTCVFYVPEDLVASYKTATNWSALPNINDRIKALEGSDYEDEDWYESTQEYRTEVLGE